MKRASARILSLLLALSLTTALIPLPVQATETAADAPSDHQPPATELQEDAEPAVSDESFSSEDVSQAAVESVPADDLSQDAPEASEPVLADTADEAEEENEQTVFSGQCGENAAWTLDTEAKTLTISGTGAMFDYEACGEAPWQASHDNYNAVETLTISEGITDIGDYNFSEMGNLRTLSLPSSLVSIGERAFSESWISWGTLVLPEGLSSIGAYAFKDCIDLKAVDLPSTLNTIGSGAFSYTDLTSVAIPQGVTEIGDYAFYLCNDLTSVTLPEGLQRIGSSAFAANNFTSINLPSTLKSIGELAFLAVPLASLTLPSGLETIGGLAFYDCTQLNSVTVPANVKAIGDMALGYCSDEGGEDILLPGFSISGYTGSAAEAYAKANNISFTYLDAPASLSTPVLKKAENVQGGVRVTWNAVDHAASYQVWRKVPGGKWGKVGKPVTGTSYIDTSVTSGTTYCYTVRAINGSVISSYDKTGVSALYLAVPALKSAVNAGNNIKLTWGAVTGASKYYIYYSTNGGKSWKTLKTSKDVTGTSYTITGGSSGTVYTYTVRAVSGSTRSYYDKAGISVMKLTVPKLIKAENAANGVTVSWEPVTGATGYTVYCTTTDGQNWKTLGKVTGTSYTATGGTSGVTYYYTVRATNGSYRSDYQRTSVSTMKLAIPKLLKAENVANSVTVTWEKVTGASGYTLYYSTNGGKNWKVLKNLTGTSYTTPGGTYGTVYTYTVRATNGSSRSYYDKAGISVMKLAVPKLIKAENTAKGITVSWESVTGATGYTVYRTTTDGKSWKSVGKVTGTSYTAADGSSGVTYYYTVRATNGSYRSDYQRASVSTMKLSIPKLVKAENTAKGITLTWEKVTGASSYALYYSTDGGKNWKTLKTPKAVTGTSYTITDGSFGTVYTYTVRAVNGSSRSYYDKAGISVMKLKTPTLGTVKASSSGLTITWTAVAGAENYRVYRKLSGEKWKSIANTGRGQTSYLDEGASSSSGYYYTVRAYTGKSMSWYDTKGICCQLGQPELNSIYNEDDGLTLDWFTVSGATSYRIYRKTENSDWSLLKTINASGDEEMMSYTDTTAASGKLYSYTVRAVSGDMTSGYDKDGLSYYRLSTPVMNTPVLQDNGIKLSWGKVTGANGYKVFRFVVDPESGERSSLEEVAWLTNRTDTIVEDYYPGYLNCYVVFAYYNNTYCSDISDVAYCDFSDVD